MGGLVEKADHKSPELIRFAVDYAKDAIQQFGYLQVQIERYQAQAARSDQATMRACRQRNDAWKALKLVMNGDTAYAEQVLKENATEISFLK